MAKIISVGTALPEHQIPQEEILHFMQKAYGIDGTPEGRKLRFLYHQSGIDQRYSVLPDFLPDQPEENNFFSAANGCPTIESRMERYLETAPALTVSAAQNCLDTAGLKASDITHFLTVSCTGLSAPGLELMAMAMLGIPANAHRTAVNFMGCYAAIHALKLAQAFADADKSAKVLIVCTELCTLHFQNAYEEEGAVSAALFGDGAAAALICGDEYPAEGFAFKGFYSEVLWQGREEMAWNLSSKGFLMRLSGYVPDLLAADIAPLLERALQRASAARDEIGHWCVHPGGKRILTALEKGLQLAKEDFRYSYDVLRKIGNISSATILFVLKEMWADALAQKDKKVFGVAFGPGLTMESFILQPA